MIAKVKYGAYKPHATRGIGTAPVRILHAEIWMQNREGVVGRYVMFRLLGNPDAIPQLMSTSDFLYRFSYFGKVQITVTKTEEVV